ncbi:unnamed protein product, partial [Iphiclides podalirius]
MFLALLSNQAASFKDQLTGETRDHTSSRPNTLFDDADDLQKQLDNEARDKLKLGKPKTVWVLHLPTPFPDIKYLMTTRYSRNAELGTTINEKKFNLENFTPANTFDWDYNSQSEWGKFFPDCKGRSQSPVDLPVEGFIRARGVRQLLFNNYDVCPENMTVHNDGRRVVLYGHWNSKKQPIVYSGAAHSRRYVFHSLSLSWPSEHTIGGLQFPMESQAIHISAEYNSLKEALDAAPSDPQAFLGISNLYKYSDHTQKGLKEILDVVLKASTVNSSGMGHPLSFFVPPFKQYASYQGSLTSPPCTESVLWLVRARSLPVMRAVVEAAHRLTNPYGEPRRFSVRMPQPLNDRKIYLFY